MLEGKTIMVVEDEALLALDLAMTFEDLGSTVAGPCYRIESALDLVARVAIDGAVLDVDLNGETIFPVARALQKNGVPFIFHTGRADCSALIAEFPEAMLCPKPTTPDRIAHNLAEAMARSGDRTEPACIGF
ncbi:response regulator [Frigidibacter oleivorans]|uniref:response regulator n=1 Tax=Frigidibacter oleivorans TaxID=2487129 RepID=UPI000F8CCC43|nr:response regulator [Frigidibacter oleivorans]